MDRNLGATSASASEVGSIGLLYQWGRKDPFLSSSSVDSAVQALSTGSWATDSATMTADNTTKNPMTFYLGWENYLPDGSWSKDKTKYDPCPAGWRVPDGGSEGIWAKAAGGKTTVNVTTAKNYGKLFGDDDYIWYPCIGDLRPSDGKLDNHGYYWSVTTPSDDEAYYAYYCDFRWYYNFAAETLHRSRGMSVRCQKIQ